MSRSSDNYYLDVAGIYGDKVYIYGNNTNRHSTTGYVVDLAAGSYTSTGWVPFGTSSEIDILPIYFDSRYIYAILRKNTYYSDKIWIVDMQTGTSNYSSISFNKQYLFSGSLNATEIKYFGTRMNDNLAYFGIGKTTDTNTNVLGQFNKITGSYSWKKATGITLSGINKLCYEIQILDSAIQQDGSFIRDGFAINWKNGYANRILGVERNRYVKTEGNTITYPYYYQAGVIIRNVGNSLKCKFGSIPGDLNNNYLPLAASYPIAGDEPAMVLTTL